ncbi:trehalose-6-phosphate synthase [Campylobacter canadensis]|uniref:Trehalose-6-phosphate synthase n=1 Tax=Campylobacter canadensis TaxID=449520 RepID=A0ABS7WQ56_9BACT|nr:trehalose-6-phosphate synthase [Campylobacter canadensis]MBZ7986511.1 trehalose-6-phosphate synthase [Campylobacter canadensis]MBZ7994084.1 trehalose-6-phosphate synthase [Campylobacter canadensis]MBZ7995913.1 trehalose-6-phosphate synthase [Campylobacter canadensis]MBZ7997547.1 trehalose-6-phosphate synthase [Campylobacter canadensis]MBZ7999415.1 trehalose-6-phosphate synthase [Campylobacter canadensis]
MDYVFINFIHLFCAILFVGYVFCDAIIMPKSDFDSNIKKAIMKKSALIYAFIFIILIASGIYLYFLNTFSKLELIFFVLKIFCIFLIFFCALLSIYKLRIKKQKDAFVIKYAHLIAIILCLFVVLFAKLIFLV